MKEAVPPAVTVWLDGCVVIAGAVLTAPPVTLKVTVIFALLPPVPFNPSHAITVTDVDPAVVGVPAMYIL